MPGLESTDLITKFEASSKQLEESSKGKRKAEGSCPPRKRRVNDWIRKAPKVSDQKEHNEEDEEEKGSPSKTPEGYEEDTPPANTEDLENVFFFRSNIRSLDDIQTRIHFNYYHLISDLVRDIKDLCEWTRKNRCANDFASRYLTYIEDQMTNRFLNESTQERFQQLVNEDIKEAVNGNELARFQGTWEQKAGPQRKYHHITDYEPVIGGERVARKMKTSKTSRCSGECCRSLEQLGPLNLQIDTWDCECECRKNKVECNSECGCAILHPEEEDKGDCKEKAPCANRAMANKERMKIGEDVV